MPNPFATGFWGKLGGAMQDYAQRQREKEDKLRDAQAQMYWDAIRSGNLSPEQLQYAQSQLEKMYGRSKPLKALFQRFGQVIGLGGQRGQGAQGGPGAPGQAQGPTPPPTSGVPAQNQGPPPEGYRSWEEYNNSLVNRTPGTQGTQPIPPPGPTGAPWSLSFRRQSCTPSDV